MGNDYKREYLMSYNLYGYDTPILSDGPPDLGSILDKARPKKEKEVPIYKDDILPEPKPEPPKFKEFNKKLINNELSKITASIDTLTNRMIDVQALMNQEGADDIYGVHEVAKLAGSLLSEWVNTKECLRKELELSLPISKPQV